MADFNSSLPIRTENAGDVIVKLSDATVTSQQLKIEADGSINTNSTMTATDLDIRDLAFATDKVDVTGSQVSLDSTTLAALENITVSATDLDIRNLSDATDSVSAKQSGTWTVDAVQSGSWTVTATATDLDIRDLAFATDKVDVSGSSVELGATTLAALENITVSATDLDIRNLSNATDSVTAHQGGSWSVTASATDLDIRDLSHSQDSIKLGDGTDFLAINSDGSLNVKISDGSPGTEVTDYNTANLASNASGDHTYTSTGNFYLQQISGSASGAMKMELKVNGATKYVFFTSASNLNYSFKLEQPLLATSGQTVVITRTNRDKSAEDVYTTIAGYLA